MAFHQVDATGALAHDPEEKRKKGSNGEAGAIPTIKTDEDIIEALWGLRSFHAEKFGSPYFDENQELSNKEIAKFHVTAMILDKNMWKNMSKGDTDLFRRMSCSIELTILEFPNNFPDAGVNRLWEENKSVVCSDERLGGSISAIDRVKYLITTERMAASQAVEVILFEFPSAFGLVPPQGWDLWAVCDDIFAHHIGKSYISDEKAKNAVECMQMIMNEYPDSFPSSSREMETQI